MYNSYYYGYDASAVFWSSFWIYVIAALVNGLICGAISNAIAHNKGYDSGFAWGFWLGEIGIIVVACKRDVSTTVSTSSSDYWSAMSGTSGQGSFSGSGRQWCCSCGHMNDERLSYCTVCRRTKSEVMAEKVTCPHCGRMNKKDNQYCYACNKPLREEEVKAIAAPVTPAPVTPAPATASVSLQKEPAATSALVVTAPATAFVSLQQEPAATTAPAPMPEPAPVPVPVRQKEMGIREAVDYLERLADLHDHGSLTDAEFSEAKRKILMIM